MKSQFTFYKVENDIIIQITTTTDENKPLEEGEFLGTPPCKVGYNVKTLEPKELTDLEIYEKARSEALADIETIEEDIKLGDATEESLLSRRLQWKEYSQSLLNNI